MADRRGLPVAITLSPGQAADKGAVADLPAAHPAPGNMVIDRGYHARAILEPIATHVRCDNRLPCDATNRDAACPWHVPSNDLTTRAGAGPRRKRGGPKAAPFPDRSAGADHSAEASATSTDTPGPMVEVSEIFLR